MELGHYLDCASLPACDKVSAEVHALHQEVAEKASPTAAIGDEVASIMHEAALSFACEQLATLDYCQTCPVNGLRRWLADEIST